MDNLDTRIIQQLTGPGSYQWNVRQSYSTIAKKLGADEETVRRRILRAERSGHLGGSELILNPFLIDREPVGMELKVANSEKTKKDEVISQIKLVDGVVMIIDLQGEALQIMLFCEDEKTISRRTQLISSIAGCRDPLIVREMGFPRPDVKLNRLDWLILKSLRKEPRKSTATIAKEVRSSARTVDRRISVLTENSAFFHVFRPDFKKSEGVVCSVIISYKDGNVKSTVDDVINSKLERVVFSSTSARMISQFNFVCNNVIEAEETNEWIQTLDGVAQVRMGIVKEFILLTDWIDEEIEKRLSKAR
jgi:DNA-binding Lrp family transcriptional regulator